MLINGVSATALPKNATTSERAISTFLQYIEKKLGVSIIRLMGDEHVETNRIAELLKQGGIVETYGRVSELPDEPRLFSWYASNGERAQVGGATWESDDDALLATLAEALERHVWQNETDYFSRPFIGDIHAANKRGAVLPSEFAGYTDDQRIKPGRELRENASYLWIQGTSIVSGKSVYVPAQLVSAAHKSTEPQIRHVTSIGLATWPTRDGARLAGINELLEREAYMIMWLNQLTLPRLALTPLLSRHTSLARHIEVCERFRLKVHIIPLLTDAPTHAVAVITEDMSGHAPRFAIGLKSHRSLPIAIEKAMTEALRARRRYRLWEAEGNMWNMTPVPQIGHHERLYYWGVPEHAEHLEFLIRGPEVEAIHKEWEHDSEKEHLERLVRWCREKEFECVSVSLGTSAKNPTPWHIEMVLMPELQPTYLTESTRAFGGTRWHDVPRHFGYTSREQPYSDRPHPFS